MPKPLTEEEKDKIIARYRAGESAAAIAVSMGCITSRVFYYLNARGVPLRRRTEYAFDSHFFDEVDSEEKAYFMGFLYADGYNGEGENHWRVSVGVSIKDEEILQKLRICLRTTRPLYYTTGRRETVALTVTNAHFSQRLSALGCHNNKSFNLRFPDWLSVGLLPHFMRGYMDGDGWVSSKERRNKMGVCGSIEFVTRYAQILQAHCGVSTNLYPASKTPQILICDVAGRDQVTTVLAWLYKDATIYLERKKHKAEQIMVPTYRLLQHHRATLTDEAAMKVKEAILAGKKTKQILQECSVSRSQLRSIRAGETWNHVTGWARGRPKETKKY